MVCLVEQSRGGNADERPLPMSTCATGGDGFRRSPYLIDAAPGGTKHRRLALELLNCASLVAAGQARRISTATL